MKRCIHITGDECPINAPYVSNRRWNGYYSCQCIIIWCRVGSHATQLPGGCLNKNGGRFGNKIFHYNDVIMSEVASQLTSLTSVYLTVCSGADRRKHQSSASLAFVWGIHRWSANSPHKWSVTRKMFPFDEVIMFAKVDVMTRKRFPH